MKKRKETPPPKPPVENLQPVAAEDDGFRDLTIEELKKMSPREQGEYLVQLYIRDLNR